MDLGYRFDYLKNKLFPYWDLNKEWKVTNNLKMIKNPLIKFAQFV